MGARIAGIARVILAAISLLLLGASCVSAQSATATPQRKLTLDEALSLAEQFNPRLRVSAAILEGAESGITTAKAHPNPALTFGAMGWQRARVDGAIGGMLNGFSVNQPLELPQMRRTRIEVAQVGRESSRFALTDTSLAVRGAVKHAFFEAIRRKGELELAHGTLQLLEDLQRRIELQVKVGEAARLEMTRADAEVATARIQMQSAELRRTAALSTLSAAVGRPLGDADPEAPLDPPASLPALEALRQEVLSRHPSIALAESETRRAEAILQHEKSLRAPQPTIWVDVFRQPDVAQLRYGVSVDLPVRNRREGQIAEAAAMRRQAAALAEQRRLELSAAVEQAYDLYQVANRQVELFEAGTLREAEAAVEAASAAFRFGERSIIEVLDAQRVLRAARQDYLNAQFDRQQALIELEQLRGSSMGGSRP